MECLGPFASAALALAHMGLAVLPVGGEDGKEPLIRWSHWKRPLCDDSVRRLINRFGHCNAGIVCHLSGISVVDIDGGPKLATEIVRRCGDTPLKIASPKGLHLYYRHCGEKSLVRLDGLSVDVKAVGGYVVVPPSVRLSGPHAGTRYRILTGSWSDVRRLPEVRPGSLPVRMVGDRNDQFNTSQAVREGARNDVLFRQLMHQVRHCDAFNDLLDVGRTINNSFMPQLTDAEVMKTAKSVWKYQINGKVWYGGEAHAVMSASELALLTKNPDALTLCCILRVSHGARLEPFAVCAKAMAEADLISRWGPRRYTHARNWLLEKGFLMVVHQGGRCRGDASQFRLSSPARVKGAASAPNITKHPPPSRLAHRASEGR